jgi:hypothetical protein
MRRLIVTAWLAALLGLLSGSGQLQNQQKQKPAATSQAQAIGGSC